VVLGALAVVFFAFEGGEYGTRDLLSRTSRRAALELEVQQLQMVVDSLKRETRSVDSDLATLERIAREEYGMVKGDRELLYRFADDLEADGDTVR
jgi:cell division protein FtsB